MPLTSESSYSEICAHLSKLTTPLLCDAFKDIRLMDSKIHPFSTEESSIAVGRAYTINSAQDSLSTMQALDDLPAFILALGCENDMVPILMVIAACGTQLAVAGGMCADVAKTKGFGGIITDGNCRDVNEIRKTGIPFFASGQNAKSGNKDTIGSIKAPINCGNVTVNPGDLILADRDGIVVMSKEEAVSAINKAEEIKEKEALALSRIHDGARFDEICNLQEHMRNIEEHKPSKLQFTH
ncbi:4-hydroxy-2-oxoglutarate aldolase [Legionella pneumophila]|uniref:RraA family protein n=1 Tax=Legionella pneumophila TaxID=446 RepID=UPI00077092D1|nr:hypothetical protein [Legionella pneumophila]CZG40041.1 4-hydroxy-2-oxoglutarate aldolase [Legionella pneumophila]CZH40964.1 4-hydroxy-2-oxoglutarate aldolase [Legionella pneumophila]